MISMKEIGKICGVAESTVSKALRDHSGIKPATRERVKEVARQYGYRPNAMVECMQTGRSRSIGIACNNFQCQFAGAIMDGIHNTLHEYGYDSYVICWDKLVKDGVDLLGRFARRRVDGLLLLPMERVPESSYIAQLHTFHNPVVLVDQLWQGCDFDYVGSDNRNGMTAITEAVIASGCKRIGAVLFSGVSSGEERKAGFFDAMFKHCMTVDAKLLCEVDDCSDSYEAIREMLGRSDRPDALICFNDYLANDALNAAYDLGIRVPEELTITGFGNLPLCEKLRPKLTTVDQRAEQVGEAATRLLIERISGAEDGPRRELLVPAMPLIRNTGGFSAAE